MSLLRGHLEQITLSCQGIDSLPFPPPKIFTNALLTNHDITTLLRDTEPHERALFSVPPFPQQPTTTATSKKPSSSSSSSSKPTSPSPPPEPKKSRRQTVFTVSSGEITTGPPTTRSAPRRTAAVAAILGPQMHETLLRKGPAAASGSNHHTDSKGDVDVEILLRGAEKLCGVYELPGALARIQHLRAKWAGLMGTLAYYEGKVAEQAELLEAINRDWREEDEYGEHGAGLEGEEDRDDGESELMTLEELRAEEEEVRELEGRKRELQERLKAMERDIGGLMAM